MSMKIDLTNYEEFLLDYLDGNLDKNQEYMLLAFLANHPEIEEEFLELKENYVTLNTEANLFYQNKDNLKKDKKDLIINDENLDELLIAKLENVLSPNEENQLNKYLEINPSASDTYSLYQKTILHPDKSIVYKNKQSLKRFATSKYQQYAFKYYISGIAAAIILLILTTSVLNRSQDGFLKTNTHIFDIALNKSINFNKNENISEFSIVRVETPNIIAKSNKLYNNQTTTSEEHDIYNNVTFLKDVISGMKELPYYNEDVNSTEKNVFTTAYNAQNNQKSSNEIDKDKIVNPDDLVFISGELHNNEYINAFLEQIDYNEQTAVDDNNQGLTFWDIADFGIKSYNKLTGKNISIKKEFDNKGKIKTLAINNNKFIYSKGD
ncbi:MAG: hypothetical protein Kow0068_21190 [Marinilabiliales bacterium]